MKLKGQFSVETHKLISSQLAAFKKRPREKEEAREESIEIYDMEKKIFDRSRMKLTEMKNNRRVIMIGSRKTDEELILAARKSCWLQTVKEYAERNCEEK